MRVDLFDFSLPTELIALRPAVPRDAARMLVLSGRETYDHTVIDLPQLLRAGDCLVFNDTRVIPVQLTGVRDRGEATVSATLMKRLGERYWQAYVRNGKRLKNGDVIDFGAQVYASVIEKDSNGFWYLDFRGEEPMADLLDRAGTIPLPPYIAKVRRADERDSEDYQTMFAAKPGAAAATTAALHFTPSLMDGLRAAGISHETVTLHVGPGTFQPMRVDDTDNHTMHSEWAQITADVASRLNAVRAAGGRVIAVGTTSLRTIESACNDEGQIQAFEGETDIFILPGYQFKGIDGLLTNFHLPQSTLFMLVSALMGRERMQLAYMRAIRSEYRFYSYGDASLLIP